MGLAPGGEGGSDKGRSITECARLERYPKPPVLPLPPGGEVCRVEEPSQSERSAAIPYRPDTSLYEQRRSLRSKSKSHRPAQICDPDGLQGLQGERADVEGDLAAIDKVWLDEGSVHSGGRDRAAYSGLQGEGSALRAASALFS